MKEVGEMLEPTWKLQDLHQQVDVLDGKKAPSILLKNARYLHSTLKQWLHGNIWIEGERIVYAGPEMPTNIEGTEIVDVAGKTLVPGYIEPHVHPFQLYNAVTFADFAAQTGTTTMLCDNLTLYLNMKNNKAFHLLDELKKLPFTFYWWVRLDSQTQMIREHNLFSGHALKEWGKRPDVLMAGELTSWPRLLDGDDQLLYWLQLASAYGKKIEGHLPGSSAKTLAKMKLFGMDGDHEAMTIEEVKNRLLHGYDVTLRYSSIRPDLPEMLRDMVAENWHSYDHLMMTTDGSMPHFHVDGLMDKCIRVALDAGVPPIEAYQMASYNTARYYNLDKYQGFIATGRVANINVLEDEFHPTPISVLSKGQWLKRDHEQVQSLDYALDDYHKPLTLGFDLTEEDFQFSMPFGIEMVNDVITKPYSINLHVNEGDLAKNHDECFLVLVDRHGKWRVNTMLKGFATHLDGFASSYSITGDIILIGKSMKSMMRAFREVREMQGGIVVVDGEEVAEKMALTLDGIMSDKPMEDLIVEEARIVNAVKERGYKHGDLIYTLLFLQATHLPYIRITQRGIFDVMKKQVLFPAVMR